MTKNLVLVLALLTFTACGKEEPKPLVCTTKPIQPVQILDKPINFTTQRIEMTKAYIKSHYGKTVSNIEIIPKIIVLHWTAEMDFDKSFKRLEPPRLLSDRKDIVKASALNVSSQFMVDRDGTIYRLMPENWMARHVIGLNYSSIGIENIGGKDNKAEDLTPAQLQANIDLVRYLKSKYPSIEYMIGHHEYRQMEATSLWLERDQGYRTVKSDPGAKFVSETREGVKDLLLKMPPKGK
ncbi:MAG: N-acetylmuramoyl-L-alanine amidase [Sulfurovum sp.]|nr:MAG: N-acetylmuramoyl-L-alanine amidase [Sulfurovum sp.]